MKTNAATQVIKTVALYFAIVVMLFMITLLANEVDKVAALGPEFADAIRLGVESAALTITFALVVDIQSYVSVFDELVGERITTAANVLISLGYGAAMLPYDHPVAKELGLILMLLLLAFALTPFIAQKIQPYLMGGETA